MRRSEPGGPKALSTAGGSAYCPGMRHWTDPAVSWLRPLRAGVMIALLLQLVLLAANRSTHARLHADSPATHGMCSICAVAQGQLLAPAIAVPAVSTVQQIAWTVPALTSAFTGSIDFTVASSRGPPNPSASL